jgi:hypothetical protein
MGHKKLASTELRNRSVSSARVHHNDRQVSKKDRLPKLRTRDYPCCNRLPKAIAKLPLIGDKVGVFATRVHSDET